MEERFFRPLEAAQDLVQEKKKRRLEMCKRCSLGFTASQSRIELLKVSIHKEISVVKPCKNVYKSMPRISSQLVRKSLPMTQFLFKMLLEKPLQSMGPL